MKWTPGSVSEDVEDRRGGGGGFRGGPVSIGVVLVLLVLSLLTGKNFLSLVDSGAAPAGDASADQSGAPVQSSPEEEKLVQFVSFVLDDAQHTWQQILPGTERRNWSSSGMRRRRRAAWARRPAGRSTVPATKRCISISASSTSCARGSARLVISRRRTSSRTRSDITCSGCGASKARCGSCRSRVQSQANALSVRLELQADCYAGVWGHSTAQRNILEQGDVESALNAAASIGDDRIQRMSGRAAHPESFTHGSSAGTRHVVQARAGQRGSERVRHIRGRYVSPSLRLGRERGGTDAARCPHTLQAGPSRARNRTCRPARSSN